jgi:hypothetical protein
LSENSGRNTKSAGDIAPENGDAQQQVSDGSLKPQIWSSSKHRPCDPGVMQGSVEKSFLSFNLAEIKVQCGRDERHAELGR